MRMDARRVCAPAHLAIASRARSRATSPRRRHRNPASSGHSPHLHIVDRRYEDEGSVLMKLGFYAVVAGLLLAIARGWLWLNERVRTPGERPFAYQFLLGLLGLS